ncbi:MAG TPA: hypothetical protein PL023_04345 [Thiobacillus sp.]|nr:hypothetical protein [Thiobacillus sp.]
MTDFTLPPRLIAFGNALTRLAERLRAELTSSSARTKRTNPVDASVTLQQHLDTFENIAARITQRLNDTNGDVLANPNASEADAHRAVALLEAEIDRLIEGRAAAAHIVSPPLTHDARHLLPAAYTHTLREILTWLDELLAVLAAPRAVLEARGLWNDRHPVLEIETCLTLTASPELHLFLARIKTLSQDDMLEALDKLDSVHTRHRPVFDGVPRFCNSPTPAAQLLDAVFNTLWFVVQLGLLAFVVLVLLGIVISFS